MNPLKLQFQIMQNSVKKPMNAAPKKIIKKPSSNETNKRSHGKHFKQDTRKEVSGMQPVTRNEDNNTY